MKTEVSKDTWDAWVERMAAGRENKPLTAGELVVPGQPQEYNSIEFLRVERPDYVGEVGKRGDDYIFHFFPKTQNPKFEDTLGDVFLEVFKNPNQIQAAWTEEVKSWAVKVTGFVHTVWGDEQALSVFEKLDKVLSK